MSEDDLSALAEKVGNSTVDLYARLCQRIPKMLVLTGMTGGLAACATEAGADREKVIAALNSAFDDIEGLG